MNTEDIKLSVVFFQTSSGAEPARRWLKALPTTHKKTRKIPQKEIGTARSRLKKYQESE